MIYFNWSINSFKEISTIIWLIRWWRWVDRVPIWLVTRRRPGTKRRCLVHCVGGPSHDCYIQFSELSISRTTSRWCKGPSHDCHIQSSVFFISHVLFLGGVQDPHTTVTQCEQYYYISRTLVFGGEHLIVDPHTTVKIWTVHWISSAAYCTLKTISHPTALSTHTYSYAYRVHSIKMFYLCIFFYVVTLWRRGSQ